MFGELGFSRFVARAVFGDLGMSLSVAGEIFGDVRQAFDFLAFYVGVCS